MVRITLYDPKISAEVYSRRRAEERAFESPVAAGLGRLGRALMAREARREARHRDKTQAMRELAKMRKKEFARLREQGQSALPDPGWSAKKFLGEHLKRRDETLAALAKENPPAARIVAEKSAALAEDVARRAMVTEAANLGRALTADINAAVAEAVETVRTDPSQHKAAVEEFRATLSELAETGMDAGAVATVVASADRKITGAAFRQRLKEDPEAAKRELEAGEYGEGLTAEETDALAGKADLAIKVRLRRAEAAAKSVEDAYMAEFKAFERRIFNGEMADDENFSDEAIRASVSPDVAERLIRERDRAEARGRAFAEIEFLSEEEIEERLGTAERDEIRHLLWARDHRRRLMK